MSGGDLVLLGVLLIGGGHLSAKVEAALACVSGEFRGGEYLVCSAICLSGFAPLFLGLFRVLA